MGEKIPLPRKVIKTKSSRRLVIHREIPPPILELDELSPVNKTFPQSFSPHSTMGTQSSNGTSSLGSFNFSSHDSEDIANSLSHRWQMESAEQIHVNMAKPSFQSQTGTSTSQASKSGSTFEEVESLDLSGSRDLRDFRDIHRIIRDFKHSNSSSGGSGGKGSTSVSSIDFSSEGDAKEKMRRRKARDLIVPDEEEGEPFPFAKHVFNKKEKKEKKDKNGKRHGSHGYHRSHSSLFDQLMQYKLQHQVSESSQSTHSSSFNSACSDIVRLPFESDYDYYLRMRRYSSCSSGPQSSIGGSVAGLSRTISLDSSSSSNVSSSSPDYVMSPPVMPTVTAEQVLLNLGFCTEGNFLPERFARDWYSKILGSRQNQEIAVLSQSSNKSEENYHPRKQKNNNTQFRENQRRQRSGGSAADFLHKLDFNSRTSASSRRAKLRRAATALSQSSTKQAESVEKQDSIDQLKYVLAKQASILLSGSGEKKRKAFASSRQKSLPIFLETLKEEDEHRLSRGPSVESPKRNKLKEFLEEEEKLSRSSSKDSSSSREVLSIMCSNIGSSPSTIPNSVVTTDDETDKSSSLSIRTTDTNVSALNDEDTLMPEKSRKPLPTIIIPQKQLSDSSDVFESENESQRYDTSNVKKCEPAMVSVVLSDTEEERHGLKQFLSLNSLSDDNFLSPTSLSVSPCPQSPVTVIEVDQLDNQNLDSTDSGDVADSPDVFPSHSENRKMPQTPELVFHIYNENYKETNSYDFFSHQNCSTETDDRTLSPLLSPSVISPKGSESAYESSEEDRIDECVQADDGTLSPLVFGSKKPISPDEYYVSDVGTQSIFISYLNKESQTKEVQLVSKAVGESFNKIFDLGRSVSDFEPQYFMTEGCQTDKSMLSSKRSLSKQTSEKGWSTESESREVLCYNCHGTLNNISSRQTSSVDISISLSNSDDNQSNDIIELPMESSNRRKLSYIDIMEMCERSESMPDYVERNVDLSDEEKLVDCLTIASNSFKRSESLPEKSYGSFDLSPHEAVCETDEMGGICDSMHPVSTNVIQVKSKDGAELLLGASEDNLYSLSCPVESFINNEVNAKVNEVASLPANAYSKIKVYDEAERIHDTKSHDVNFERHLQGFDLEALLERIERIENMITSVTSVYSKNEKVDAGLQCSLPKQESSIDAEALTSDISSMVSALNKLNKSFDDASPPSTVSPTSRNVSDLMEQFENQPKRKLTKTMSVDIGGSTKRPTLDKRRSLQRQSNIDTCAASSKVPGIFEESSPKEINTNHLNVWKRRNTDGILHDLQVHSVLLEEDEPVDDDDDDYDDDDKESIISDVFEDEFPDDISDEDDLHYGRQDSVSADAGVGSHHKIIHDEAIDTEIARMRAQLKMTSSESSEYTGGPSLFERFNIVVSELPTVPTSPSSITRGVLQTQNDLDFSKSHISSYKCDIENFGEGTALLKNGDASLELKNYDNCPMGNAYKNVDLKNNDEAVTDFVKMVSKEMKWQPSNDPLEDHQSTWKNMTNSKTPYLSGLVQNDITAPSHSMETSPAYSRFQNLIKQPLSKVSNSSVESSKSHPAVKAHKTNMKYTSSESLDNSIKLKNSDSLISSSSLEKLPSDMISKQGKSKPKDINQFQALLMDFESKNLTVSDKNSSKEINAKENEACTAMLPTKSVSDVISLLPSEIYEKDQASYEKEKERLAWNIADDIFGNIHDQLLNRTEMLSDLELDYTVLKAVNHTMDKLIMDIDEDEMPLGWPEVQTSL